MTLYDRLKFFLRAIASEEASDLSIDSSVSADTPSDYTHHTDVSITSTVSADTPSNI